MCAMCAYACVLFSRLFLASNTATLLAYILSLYLRTPAGFGHTEEEEGRITERRAICLRLPSAAHAAGTHTCLNGFREKGQGSAIIFPRRISSSNFQFCVPANEKNISPFISTYTRPQHDDVSKFYEADFQEEAGDFMYYMHT